MFFEDFEVSQRFRSPARTIGEADVTMFSMISGDWSALHSDAVYAASTPFGRRIAHGALGIAVVTGMLTRLGIFEGTAVAMLDLQDWRFHRPIFIDDTLHLDLEITSKRLARDGARGVIGRKMGLINQEGQTVQEGASAILVLARPSGQDAREASGRPVAASGELA